MAARRGHASTCQQSLSNKGVAYAGSTGCWPEARPALTSGTGFATVKDALLWARDDRGRAALKVRMRIPKRQEWEFRGPRTVKSILEEMRINPETVIVIRGDTLLTSDAVVEDSDEIEVRPALSGG